MERLFQLQTNKIFPPKVMEQAMDATRRSFAGEDTIAKLENSGLLGPVLASGLRCVQKNPQATDEDVKSSMEMSGRIAAHHLERYLPALATIASVAPLLGLLGTVVGMIEIFGATNPSGSQPAQLAHGISIALYNTAFGLIVAIPTLMFWRYFRGVADRHLLALEVSAERFARHVAQLRS
jgi:biopolymer transport protein ExbB